MKLQKTLMFIFILTFITLSVNMVSSFMPTTHQFIFSEAQKSKIDSNLYNSCAKYPDLCYTGNIMSDVSVIYYYTQFKRYEVTHTPAFCQSLLQNANGEEEMACAVGACTHQPHDMVSHNFGVTFAITNVFLPNSVIHTFEEQHVDNIILSEHPDAKTLALNSLNSYTKCEPLFKRVLQTNNNYNGVDLDSMFSKFISEVQGSKTGYDPNFYNLTAIPPIVLITYIFMMLFFISLSILILLKRLRYSEKRTIINWVSFFLFLAISFVLISLFIANIGGKAFDTFVFIIKPVSNLVPVYPVDQQVNLAIQWHQQFMKDGMNFLTSQYNKGIIASGSNALSKADASIVTGQYVILSIILLSLITLIYFNFRKRR